MSGAKALAPFAYDWVGGDIHGLQMLGEQCSRAASVINTSDQALSRKVAAVVEAGSWEGSAASAFSTAWNADSRAGAQVAQAWTQIGTIAGNLAANLATLENALEQAADQVEKQGVYVNPANGEAVAGANATGASCPDAQVMASRTKLVNSYESYRASILSDASVAKAEAALALGNITQEILPSPADWGDVANGLDTARSLWAIPTTYRVELDKELTEASSKANTAQRAAWEELIAKRRVAGNNALLDKSTRDSLSETRGELAEVEGKLASSPPESALTMTADGDAEGLGLAGLASGTVRVLPFVGTAAGAGITIWQDRAAGESWGHSVSDGIVSNGSALAAGTGVAAVIGGGSVVAVGSGVVVGAVVAVGVGDFVHNVFQENWQADWQAHGAVMGTIDGVGDAAKKTGQDLLHLADDLNPF
ncbi:MAG: hypothetical protein ACRDN0_07515 [Trebonia sp.]